MNLRLTALVLATASCGRCGRDPEIEIPPVLEAPRRDGGAKGTGLVRAYPPHAIRADGVGPYVLGQDLKQVLRALPEGPNLELLQLGRYANWRVARAEGGAIAIGADSENVVQFVSVLQPEVARTSAGAGVGATGAELAQALGAPDSGLAVVRDRQVWTFASLPTVSFLTAAPPDAGEDASVFAVVVARREGPPPPRRAAACAAGLPAPREELLAAARGTRPASEEALVASGCATGHVAEAAVVSGGELALVGGEPGKLRRLAAAPVTAGFVGFLDVDGDGREEIVTGAQGVADNEHSVTIQVHRFEAGKLVPVLSERPFVIGAAAAAAAGVVPSEIELAIQVRGGRGEIEVGGFYLSRRGGALRGVAPLAPVVLKIDSKKPLDGKAPRPAGDAGPVDAAPQDGGG